MTAAHVTVVLEVLDTSLWRRTWQQLVTFASVSPIVAAGVSADALARKKYGAGHTYFVNVLSEQKNELIPPGFGRFRVSKGEYANMLYLGPQSTQPTPSTTVVPIQRPVLHKSNTASSSDSETEDYDASSSQATANRDDPQENVTTTKGASSVINPFADSNTKRIQQLEGEVTQLKLMLKDLSSLFIKIGTTLK